MYCRFALKMDNKDNMPTSLGGSAIKDTSKQFIFAETHLKAKPQFLKTRVQETLKIVQFFNENF